ncbi:hypothetical protein HNP36_002732 [Chryseobacterium shigense]|uniref:Uncharacterized protein n=1 Tax=Chryseobacterium shigense TaxID=297244 RepID=A0A841N582_9FLAO|nr:hypothetical protein [Chryseobacterium shigense]
MSDKIFIFAAEQNTMKKNTNVLKTYLSCIYTKCPVLPEAFNNAGLIELRTGTFIF